MASALGLVACAGGGGGDSSAPAATVSTTSVSSGATTTTTTTTAATPTPVGPSATSDEFTRNYALGAIHADSAFTAGASGAGITVAVVDTGVNGSGSDLAGRVSPLSIDADTTRNTPVGTDLHATWVAGVLASNFDGQGTVGVAFNSTVLSIRADTGATGCSDVCISTSLAANAIDYAIAHGAKVVNMSFSGQTGSLGSAFEAALQRGVNAGLIFAMAAGNNGNGNTTWPAVYATDPRFAGSIIIAGASTQTGALASYSNTAGQDAAAYLVAPGDNLITACNGTKTCTAVTGTSFSTPVVAGAMALLLQAFPNMTGKQVVDLLLRTADSLGSTATYGQGMLDLQRAFQPVGSVTVASARAGQAASVVTSTPGAFVGSAVGDAIINGGGLTTAGRDFYNRLFVVNLAQGYQPTAASIIAPAPASILSSADVDLPSFAQGHMHIAAAVANGRLDPSTYFHWMLANPQAGDLAVSYEHGGLALLAWKGSGLANPFFASQVDAFTAIAQPDQALRAQVSKGALTFTAEAGSGQRLTPDRMQRQAGSSYFSGGGEWRIGAVSTTLNAGALVEPLGPLGSYLPQSSGYALPSKTGFLSVSSRWAVAPGIAFDVQASAGRTKFQGAFLSTPTAALSSAWRMSLDGNCRALGLLCTGVHLSLSQPLRVEQGRFSATLPDVPAEQSDPLTFSTRTFSASPSGREVDLRLRADQTLRGAGTFSLEGVVSRDPGNRADAPPALGLLGGWKVQF